MSLDPYKQCPCGSGKKLKFCCLSVTDLMSKVHALQEKGNVRQAMQLLEKQNQQEVKEPWVCIALASLLLEQGKVDEAKQTLKTLLKVNAEHSAAIGLYALASVSSGKYEDAKSVIYKVFQSGSKVIPDLACDVAAAVAAHFSRHRHFMASRAYLVLAMRLSPNESKQDRFYELMSFDANHYIPYPLRSVQQLKPFLGNDEENKTFKKAMKLADLGCYAPAARLFAKLVEDHSEEPILHQNAGFCFAWDGDESQAAHMLHRAAELTENRADAVELETISQLLAWNCTEETVQQKAAWFDVSSVSQMLTRLDEQEQAQRRSVQQDRMGVEMEAAFEILDRPRLSNDQVDSLTPADIPHVLGELLLVTESAVEEGGKRVQLNSPDPESFDKALELVQQFLGAELKLTDEEPVDIDEELANLSSRPLEQVPYFWNWSFPPKFPDKIRDELVHQHWNELLYEKWSTQTQAVLNNQSPQELSEEPVALLAAVYVLDSLAIQRQLPLDIPRLCETVKVEPLPKIKPTEQHPFSTFTSMQLNHLDFSELDDDQMLNVMNRALLMHYDPFLEQVLLELLNNRPECKGKFDRFRAFRTLVQTAVQNNQDEQALKLIAQALSEAEQEENSFEPIFEWKLRELTVRLRTPSDPSIPDKVRYMQEFYGSKIPEFKNVLESLKRDFDLPEGIIDPSFLTAAEEPATGEQKLWLPGQD